MSPTATFIFLLAAFLCALISAFVSRGEGPAPRFSNIFWLSLWAALFTVPPMWNAAKAM